MPGERRGERRRSRETPASGSVRGNEAGRPDGEGEKSSSEMLGPPRRGSLWGKEETPLHMAGLAWLP